ncbi:MAG: calcium/sodium antiporter [Verrucomicrobiota bacterium]|nr:calcium/sodium antiporter [Verrucomicrobiota bacterium]
MISFYNFANISLSTGKTPINLLLFAFGFYILVKGSDIFVDAASDIAHHYKISELIIGLTLVSIGTSLPEFATNVCASLLGEGEIALGDVLGSNITNIALVLGVGTLLSGKLPVTKVVLKRDISIMMSVFLLFSALCYVGLKGKTHILSKLDGGILLFSCLVYCFFLFSHKDMLAEELSAHKERNIKLLYSWLLLIAGGTMIFLGAKLLVDNTVQIATAFNLNKGVIAATIVAFGTSAPELAVTIASVKKGKNGIALGNVIGSCTLNILLVMGASALIAPIAVPLNMLFFIFPIMIICGVLLAIFMRTNWKLERYEGIILLFIYVLFIIYNISQISNT